MRGQVARMHRALTQYMLDTHTDTNGYTEMYKHFTPLFEWDFVVLVAGNAW